MHSRVRGTVHLGRARAIRDVEPIENLLVSRRLGDLVEVGIRILHEHYGAEPYGWRAGGVSLREVARRLDVGLSMVYRCVAIASMLQECGTPLPEHLGVSHLRELLSLDVGRQRELIAQAEAERWTVVQVRDAVAQEVRADGSRPGRVARDPGTSGILALVRSWTADPDRLEALDEIRHLSATQRAELLSNLHTMQMELEMLEYRLHRG